MNRPLVVITLFLSASLSAKGQAQAKSIPEKKTIDLALVDSIEISLHVGHAEFYRYKKKRLTTAQCAKFVKYLKNSKQKWEGDLPTFYYIEVAMRDGTKRTFKTHRKFVKEIGDDWVYKIKRRHHFEKLLSHEEYKTD